MDLLPLLARVAVSLGLVLGLIFFLQRAARRRNGGRTLDAARFTVVARQSLTRSAGVTVLRVGDEALVVGVTDAAVQLLARMPLDSFSGTAAAADDTTEAEVVNVREVRTEVTLPSSSTRSAFTPSAFTHRAVATVGVGTSARDASAPRPALAGSALSPATWTSALEVLRERTTRR